MSGPSTYEPKTGIEKWLDTRLPIIRLAHDSFVDFPTPRNPRENQQEQFVRDLEIDPKLYYPPHAYRKPTQTWPGVTINPREMLKARGIEIDED